MDKLADLFGRAIHYGEIPDDVGDSARRAALKGLLDAAGSASLSLGEFEQQERLLLEAQRTQQRLHTAQASVSTKERLAELDRELERLHLRLEQRRVALRRAFTELKGRAHSLGEPA